MTETSATGSSRTHLLIRVASAFAAIGISAVLAIVTVLAIGSEREVQLDRLAARNSQTADTVALLVSDIKKRQQLAVESFLDTSSNRALKSSFRRIMRSQEFETGLLTTSTGKVLAAYPPRPGIVGRNISILRRDISQVARGEVARSDVIDSVVVGQPIVSFPTLVTVDGDRLVVAGGYIRADNPIQTLFNVAGGFDNERFFVLDARGRVVAANLAGLPVGIAIKEIAPGVSVPIAADTILATDVSGQTYLVSRDAVPETVWTVVFAVPAANVLDIDATSNVIRWLVLAVLTIALLIASQLIAQAIIRNQQRLTEASLRDPLTGLANRRMLTRQARSWRQAHEHVPTAVAILDIDDFKRINDTFGHAVGDQVLVIVANRLVSACRVGDMVSRWGGEEFVAVSQGVDPDELHVFGERLRRNVGQLPITVNVEGTDAELDVTVSVGVTSTTFAKEDINTAVERADGAMYEAKQNGKNQTQVVAPAPTP